LMWAAEWPKKMITRNSNRGTTDFFDFGIFPLLSFVRAT
jgi:hypothetical protein